MLTHDLKLTASLLAIAAWLNAKSTVSVVLAVASSSQNVSFYSVQYVQNFAFGFSFMEQLEAKKLSEQKCA